VADDTISLDERRAKKEGKPTAMIRGSVNDLASRKEAIDVAVGAARTAYDQIAEEHAKGFAELERQFLARIRPLEERVTQLEARTWRGIWRRIVAWANETARGMAAAQDAFDAIHNGLPDLSKAHTPDEGAIELPPIAEFAEWGVEADAWLGAGGVAIGPDAIHVGPEFRRLRAPNTEALRIYAEALGGSREDIDDGETSKTVDGLVLEDCRKLIRGEQLVRKDTKPELVKDEPVALHHQNPLDPGKCVGCGEPWPCSTRLKGTS
jgi:hypothetical protein